MKLSRTAGLVRSLVCAAGVCVGVAGAMVLTAAPAMAQPGGGGGRGGFGGGGPGGGFMGRMFAPVMSERDLGRATAVLNLTEDQKAAVKTLREGYAEQSRTQMEDVRAQFEKARNEFRDSQDPSAFEKLRPTAEKARADRKKADEQFMTDVKAVLTPEQQEKWPVVERTVRRITTVRRGLMSGERVDVVALVDDLGLSASEVDAIKPTLDQYEQDLDRELIARNKQFDEGMDQLAKLRESGDMAAMQDLIKKGREQSVKVRDVNRRYERMIEELLPEGKKTQLAEAFKKESFPEVYRESNASRSLDAAVGFADLTAEQKEQVLALRESYRKNIASTNEKLSAAIEESEMTFDISQMGRGQRQDNPANDLRRDRRDLDRSTVEKLRAILTDAQKERLPQPERGGPDGGRRRQRGGGDGGGEMEPRDPT